MKRVLLLIALLVGVGCQGAQAPVPTSTPADQAEFTFTLTALGDSLTEGMSVEPEKAYPAQLEARLQAAGLPWRVINAGLSGETSTGALSRLDWVLKTNPQAVLVVTGANDGLRGVDPEVTRKNLESIVTKLQAAKIKVMLGGMKAPPNLGQDYTKKFEAVYTAVAQEHGVPLLPFFLEGVAKVPELNQEDGKHPNAEGYTKVVDNILEPVKEWLSSSDTP